MAKVEAKEFEGTLEPFKCKICVLRVSIHCEGCKRKVVKILHNINGVHSVEIDRKQQKVTITTNIDEQSLIKRLIKAGMHAEPWPETKPISKIIKEKQIPVEIPPGETSASVRDGGKKKQTTETEPPAEELQVPPRNEEKSGTNENVRRCDDGHGDATETGGPVERVVESPPNISSETQPGMPSGAVDIEASCSGDGEVMRKKKKKKKAQAQRKEKNSGAVAGEMVSPQTVPTPTNIGSPTPPNQIPSSNHSPPFNHPLHTTLSQPAYIASYNTAYPTNTHDAYYASPPSYSYAYVHSMAPTLSSSLPIMEQPYAYAHSIEPRNISPLSSLPPVVEQSNSPPSSPFDFFSDENPSGCSIM
uniref:HMA domain-containing protein n=1 Tax=Cucumis sativus TaxID=3659 RepID=A0A0A0LZ09_CUCSA